MSGGELQSKSTARLNTTRTEKNKPTPKKARGSQSRAAQERLRSQPVSQTAKRHSRPASQPAAGCQVHNLGAKWSLSMSSHSALASDFLGRESLIHNLEKQAEPRIKYRSSNYRAAMNNLQILTRSNSAAKLSFHGFSWIFIDFMDFH